MDLYSILGVPPSAPPEEIERAYRRLARRYHPGLNPGDRHAAERFRQVDSAYRILGDRERRQAYDRQGAMPAAAEAPETRVSFAGFDFSAMVEGTSAATFSELFSQVFQDAARRATTPERGLQILAELRLSFEEAVRGGTYRVVVVRQEGCGICRGHGWVATSPAPCPDCGGAGSRRSARGHMVFMKPCDRCDGRGQLTTRLCQECGGSGVRARSETVPVDVPAGVESGARLVVPGGGHAVRGGVPGDLYVTVQVAPHRCFKRSGRDLLLTLPLAVHEAALGARVDVPTLGGPTRLRIPPGTSSGQRLRLRGRGVPAPGGDPEAAGDLLIECQIVLPPVRDERSKALLKEFGELNDVDVRKDLFEGV
jgi:molecular chaperone DnaJ